MEWRIKTKQKVEILFENKTKCSILFFGTEKRKKKWGEVNTKTKTKSRSYLLMSNRPLSNIIMIINLTTPRSAITQHSQQNMTGNDHCAQFLLISFIPPLPPPTSQVIFKLWIKTFWLTNNSTESIQPASLSKPSWAHPTCLPESATPMWFVSLVNWCHLTQTFCHSNPFVSSQPIQHIYERLSVTLTQTNTYK